MTGDVVVWSGVGYPEYAAASGPRNQSQRRVSNKTNTHTKLTSQCDYQSSSVNSQASSDLTGEDSPLSIFYFPHRTAASSKTC